MASGDLGHELGHLDAAHLWDRSTARPRPADADAYGDGEAPAVERMGRERPGFGGSVLGGLVGFQDVNSIFVFLVQDLGWIQDVSSFCSDRSDSCLMCFCYFPWLE